jgi:hypothetical protein
MNKIAIMVPVNYAFNAIRGRTADVGTVVIETMDQACADEWLAYVASGGTVRVDSTVNGKVLFPKGLALPEERGPCPPLETRTNRNFLDWYLNPRWTIGAVSMKGGAGN